MVWAVNKRPACKEQLHVSHGDIWSVTVEIIQVSCTLHLSNDRPWCVCVCVHIHVPLTRTSAPTRPVLLLSMYALAAPPPTASIPSLLPQIVALATCHSYWFLLNCNLHGYLWASWGQAASWRTAPRPLSLSPLSLPLRLGGNVFTRQQGLKVTFQSDIWFLLQIRFFPFLFFFYTLKWMKAGGG